MAQVQVQCVNVLDNPSLFTNPFQFELTFECLENLESGKYLTSLSDLRDTPLSLSLRSRMEDYLCWFRLLWVIRSSSWFCISRSSTSWKTQICVSSERENLSYFWTHYFLSAYIFILFLVCVCLLYTCTVGRLSWLYQNTCHRCGGCDCHPPHLFVQGARVCENRLLCQQRIYRSRTDRKPSRKTTIRQGRSIQCNNILYYNYSLFLDISKYINYVLIFLSHYSCKGIY